MTVHAAPNHPAKYSPGIIDQLTAVLVTHLPPAPLFPPKVLDPFAGTGRIHQLRGRGYETTGIEIEPEWAATSPWTMVGDATRLPFDPQSFDAVVTSPCYGNRMADTYAGDRDRCISCAGTGCLDIDYTADIAGPCRECSGTGLRPSKRYTYRIALGHDLAPGSAGGLQWGHEYRQLHLLAWGEARRVIVDNGLLVLNISDHIRNGGPQGVDLWHAATLGRLGFVLLEQHPVTTKRSKNGANRDARTLCEWVLVFRKASRLAP